MSKYETFMREALDEAGKAAEIGEVPVGAVIVKDDRVIARAHNMVEAYASSSAHAEMLAIDAAEARLGAKWLTGCDMYVTLEPCAMCAGAMVLARLDRLFIGTMDPKNGAAGSVMDVTGNAKLNHEIDVQSGILRDECAEALTAFFRELRITRAQMKRQKD
jgi:tRNA(adenine34) deaminase